MATPRPKTFRAVCDFQVAGQAYATGDEVPHGAVLATVLKFGDRFVAADESRRRQSAPPTSNEEAD